MLERNSTKEFHSPTEHKARLEKKKRRRIQLGIVSIAILLVLAFSVLYFNPEFGGRIITGNFILNEPASESMPEETPSEPDKPQEDISIEEQPTDLDLGITKSENLDTSPKTLDIPEGYTCKTFTEQVLWSSSYSSKGDSVKYYAWYPKHNCSEINAEECSINALDLKVRFLSGYHDDSLNVEGYVKIATPKENLCDDLQQGNYARYLAYDLLNEEIYKNNYYCGSNKNLDEKCGIDFSNSYEYMKCYGIKVYGSQYLITDIFEVKYLLCANEEEVSNE